MQPKMENKNICEMSSSVFNEIVSLLDNADPKSPFHWRGLLKVLPRNLYRDTEIEGFSLKLLANQSPSRALLYNLGAKNFKVNDLIGWLEKMRHERALELLKDSEPLVIVKQPVDEITVTEGKKLTLDCEATGFPRPSYQWIRNNKLISGQNGPTLVIESTGENEGGDYICWIRNAVQPEGICTNWVAVEVIKNPELHKPSIPQPEQTGQTAAEKLQRHDENIPEQVTSTDCHSIEDNTLMPQAQFDKMYISEAGPPVIIEPPSLASGQVSFDEPIHLRCKASGSNLHYQWIKDDTLLPRETAPALWIQRPRLENAGAYQCIIKNVYGEVRTNKVHVRINTSLPEDELPIVPKIFRQPVSMTLEGPANASFFCGARGRGVLVYQWFKDGNIFQGQCSSRLEVPVNNLNDAAKYQCEVSNEHGKVFSDVAELKINFADSVQYTAQDKYALLIGNQYYRSEPPLYAASTDLRTLTVLLNHLGYKVITLLDISKEETNNAINNFCELLDKGVYGVLYFVGHGFEHGGQCYLAPCDVTPGFSTPDCICAEDVLERMQARDPALVVLFLDICRERNVRADYETPHIFTPKVRGNAVIGYASSFTSRAYEEREGFFMRNLKKVLCRNKTVEHVFIDFKRELYNDPLKQGYEQYPELRANLLQPRSLKDPIDYQGNTRAFFIRQEKWRCLAGDLLKVPPPMVFTQRELQLSIEIKCAMVFANVMKAFVTVLDLGKTTMCEGWLSNFPNKILAKDPKKTSNGHFCKTEVTLQDLQRLQEPLRLDLFIRYATAESQTHQELTHRLPEIPIPLIRNNLCQPLFGNLPTQPTQPKVRQPIEQEEKDYT